MHRRGFLSLATAPAFAQSPAPKRLIVHADDAGMCHSVNMATREALEKGIVSSASVMMPCPWVQEFCDWAKTQPTRDLGLHLTLTSEWKYYRWRPVASIDKVKGLIDAEGYMWRDVRSSATNSNPAEVEIELRAQIERAKSYGLKFTHFDTHMGTLYARQDFFEVYTKLAREYGVPCMLPKPSGVNEAELKTYPITLDSVREKQRQGFAMLDRLVTGVPGRNPAERRESYKTFLANLQPGVTKLIIHLAKDDAEIRAVSNAWEYRWADFLFWTSNEAKDLLAQHNIDLYTYRQLGESQHPA